MTAAGSVAIIKLLVLATGQLKEEMKAVFREWMRSLKKLLTW